nr:hypothetical protein [Shigella flexneri]
MNNIAPAAPGTAGTEVAVVLKIGGADIDKVIGHYLNINTINKLESLPG